MQPITEYPYLSTHETPGRCRHAVMRLGRMEPCYRPAQVRVEGVGLCWAHARWFAMWRRGGMRGTPAALFDYLAFGSRVTGVVSVVETRADGTEACTTLYVPAGWSIRSRAGKHGYRQMTRRAIGDGVEWELARPTDPNRRRSRWSVAADDLLTLDEDGHE